MPRASGAFPAAIPRFAAAADALSSEPWVAFAIAPDGEQLAVLTPRALELRSLRDPGVLRWRAPVPHGGALAFDPRGVRLGVVSQRAPGRYFTRVELTWRLFDAVSGQIVESRALPSLPGAPFESIPRDPERVLALEATADGAAWVAWTDLHRVLIRDGRATLLSAPRAMPPAAPPRGGALLPGGSSGATPTARTSVRRLPTFFYGPSAQHRLRSGAIDAASDTLVRECDPAVCWYRASTGALLASSTPAAEVLQLGLRDGRSALALEERPALVQRLAVEPAEQTSLWGLPSRWFGASWSRDGTLLAVWGERFGFQVVSVADGVVQCTHAQLTPARVGLYGGFTADGALFAVDSATGQPARLDPVRCVLGASPTPRAEVPWRRWSEATQRWILSEAGRVWAQGPEELDAAWSRGVDGMQGVALSRDERWVLVGETGGLRVLSARDGTDRGLYRPVAPPVGYLALGDYAQRICSGSVGGDGDPTPVVLRREPDGGVGAVPLLPGGALPELDALQHILDCEGEVYVFHPPRDPHGVTVARGGRTVAHFDASTFLDENRDPGGDEPWSVIVAPDGRSMMISTENFPWQILRW